MIPVKRPEPIAAFTAPDGNAVKATNALIASVVADPAAKLKFTASVWKPAKKPYWRAQHSKCVFCEGFVPAQSHGDVEHFRPKNGVSETRGSKTLLKTYWWLAYDWSNYWASCQLCNQSSKKNLFPLTAEGVRALSPADDLTIEKPLLLDASLDDPREHLEFKQEQIFPRNGSERGRATIEICRLDREELDESRRLGLLAILTVLNFYLNYPGLPALRQDCITNLRLFIAPNYPYSAMARDLIARKAPELITP